MVRRITKINVRNIRPEKALEHIGRRYGLRYRSSATMRSAMGTLYSRQFGSRAQQHVFFRRFSIAMKQLVVEPAVKELVLSQVSQVCRIPLNYHAKRPYRHL